MLLSLSSVRYIEYGYVVLFRELMRSIIDKVGSYRCVKLTSKVSENDTAIDIKM
jgi:hypothetical protein